MNYELQKATGNEIPAIWNILQQAIERRRHDGSEQWQNGYPNLDIIKKDIETDAAYVLRCAGKIIGYSAVIFNDEPAYKNIRGKWLTDGDFVVVHRVAVADGYTGKGIGRKIFELIERLALENGIHSIKVDTNFDNIAMLRNLEKLGYTYCGEVSLAGGERKAFEKLLDK